MKGDLGTLVFTPVANWNGDATFGFQVSDQSDRLSGTATATVTVTAVNDAPTAGALGKSTSEDTALTFAASDFEGKFSDLDTGDSLKSVKVVTLPASTAGALALGGTAVSADDVIAKADLGTLVFTPVANWNGAASFTFKVVDQFGRGVCGRGDGDGDGDGGGRCAGGECAEREHVGGDGADVHGG